MKTARLRIDLFQPLGIVLVPFEFLLFLSGLWLQWKFAVWRVDHPQWQCALPFSARRRPDFAVVTGCRYTAGTKLRGILFPSRSQPDDRIKTLKIRLPIGSFSWNEG